MRAELADHPSLLGLLFKRVAFSRPEGLLTPSLQPARQRQNTRPPAPRTPMGPGAVHQSDSGPVEASPIDQRPARLAAMARGRWTGLRPPGLQQKNGACAGSFDRLLPLALRAQVATFPA
jgi:hypothetical protein